MHMMTGTNSNIEDIEKYFHSEVCYTPAKAPRSYPEAVVDNSKDTLEVCYFKHVPKVSFPAGGTVVNLVFAHGTGLNSGVWDYYLVPLLKAAQQSNGVWSLGTVLFVDQVNHGDSAVRNAGKLGMNCDWGDGSHDICLVALKELPLPGKDIINIAVGHSMGGCQVMYTTIIYPGLFSMIIGLEPVVWTHTEDHTNYLTAIPHRVYDSVLAKNKDYFANEEDFMKFRSTSLYVKSHPDIEKRFWDYERISNPDGSISMKCSVPQLLASYVGNRPAADMLMKCLRFVRTPMVSIFGGASHWCHQESKDFLRDNVPNYIVDSVPGGTHLFCMEIPDAVNEFLVKYIVKAAQEPRDNLAPVSDRDAKFQELYRDLAIHRIGNGRGSLFKL
ncbi:HEL242Cp [Eremothecium sinecaudum]|uniref:HEL242Cp n=1 Tax=Eremothecium sinecaudum TaxID=45286 RepID=A0A0X8HTA0_9SACH|nr:HEL242Cp [Eremothecium sinecaudum]AMD21039.1 HEL242Cp [Eremothecium sinecaudum]